MIQAEAGHWEQYGDTMSVSQAAQACGLSMRQMRQYCAEGRVMGAQKVGHAWVIPRAGARQFAAKPRPVGRKSWQTPAASERKRIEALRQYAAKRREQTERAALAILENVQNQRNNAKGTDCQSAPSAANLTTD